jgi:predicted phage tail protein
VVAVPASEGETSTTQVATETSTTPIREPSSTSSAAVVTSDVQTTTVMTTASDGESLVDAVTTDGTQTPTTTVQPISTPSSTTTTTATPGLNTAAASVSALADAPQVSGVTATIADREAGTFKERIVTISWLGSGADYYDLHRRSSTTNVWQFKARHLGDGEVSIRDSFWWDASWGNYQYRVTPLGGAPVYVSVDVPRPSYPPSIPRSVRAVAGFGAVTVRWTAPTIVDGECDSTRYSFCDPTTSYTVAWAPSGGTWQRVTTTSTNRTISGLRVGVTYYVTVRANNRTGSSAPTSSVAAKPMAPTPTAPRQPTATPGVRRITLTWVSPAAQGASAIARQVIQRSQNKINWVSVNTTLAPAARSFTVTNLANGVRYYFRIASVNGHGQGPWSTVVTAATPAVPTAPRSVTATPGHNLVTLRWAAPASTGGSPIIGYTISYAPGGGTWKSVNVSATIRSLIFTGLRGGTTYYFRITAYNPVGRSPSTTSVKATPIA